MQRKQKAAPLISDVHLSGLRLLALFNKVLFLLYNSIIIPRQNAIQKSTTITSPETIVTIKLKSHSGRINGSSGFCVPGYEKEYRRGKNIFGAGSLTASLGALAHAAQRSIKLKEKIGFKNTERSVFLLTACGLCPPRVPLAVPAPKTSFLKREASRLHWVLPHTRLKRTGPWLFPFAECSTAAILQSHAYRSDSKVREKVRICRMNQKNIQVVGLPDSTHQPKQANAVHESMAPYGVAQRNELEWEIY